MKYFAYGSNLSLARLQKRVPSAERLGIFKLSKHQLRFHKISKDGSAKCDAFYTGKDNDFVLGALFEIDKSEKHFLDKAEGLGNGYDEKSVTISDIANSSSQIQAFSYYAQQGHIDPQLNCYCWYLNHVLVGFQECQFPLDYQQEISQVECIEDLDKQRDALERAIHQ